MRGNNLFNQGIGTILVYQNANFKAKRDGMYIHFILLCKTFKIQIKKRTNYCYLFGLFLKMICLFTRPTKEHGPQKKQFMLLDA